MMIKKWILFGISMMSLMGCVTREPSLVPVTDPALAWSVHQKQLENLQAWELDGKAGISDGVRAQSVDFTWIQKEGGYQIDFYGPLNVRVATLNKKAGSFTLTSSSGIQSARSPEALMQQSLGFSLPVSGLEDWIIGLPQSADSEKQLNIYGYLKSLKESGWSLEYREYGAFDGVWFPRQILLKNAPFRVVLVIQGIKINH